MPSVVEVGTLTFSGCNNLASVYMPKVRSIGLSAFSGSELTSVKLPAVETISKIQFRAFANCGLTSIKLQDLYGDVSIERTALGYKIGANGSETKINGFKIYGNPGTSVEKYARENGFEFISSKPKAERFTLKLASETMDYTGKAVKPKITVTYKGKKVAAKNYTVKYSNNKETETATIEW
ncbi:leucine-rich repeat domain-containing protein [Blautia sp. MSJ-9]|nr:leucine-rich repeat protein [Blautia sp. MSJ-9]MBU5679393.1 leucine-rich repeat domain-containing protein [Blautia sp. MSJ-9]